MKKILQPLILCGGSGTRLWPVSSTNIPKQFIEIGKKGTLLELTTLRVNNISKLENMGVNKCEYEFKNPYYIVNENQEIPQKINIDKTRFIKEKYINDTAVAIARGCNYIKNIYGDKSDQVIIVAFPSDHYVENELLFCKDILSGIDKCCDDNIILFGILPTFPETGYGYINANKENGDIEFFEKPDMTTAENFIKKGALWNSGIFAAYLNSTIDLLKNNSKYNIWDWIEHPRPGKAPSFDIAVLQEHKNIICQPCSNWGWNDVGTWKYLTSLSEVQNEIKFSVDKTVFTHDCHNTTIVNKSNGHVIALGCDDILVATNNNDVLIMSTKKNYDSVLKQISSNI